MIYALHDDAGDENVRIKSDSFKHLIKARRMKTGDTIILRHLDKSYNYTYVVQEIQRNHANLTLLKQESHSCQSEKELHVGWCMIDPKSIEKVLASAVELGVTTISFINCERSQQNFKLDQVRFERIIQGAMQQSGRTNPLKLSFNLPLEAFLNNHTNITVLDFANEHFSTQQSALSNSVLIGAEGGFCPKEKELLQTYAVKRLQTPMVLRSETALLAVASLLLL